VGRMRTIEFISIEEGVNLAEASENEKVIILVL
jgi:hypothetical protein